MRISKEIIKKMFDGFDVCVVGPKDGPWKHEIVRDIKRFFKNRVTFVL